MEAVKPVLKNILAERVSSGILYKRNALKECLQTVVLDFIYSHPRHNGLVFYGGSCLAQCYGLPRLSEDLDFVDLSGKVSLSDLTADLSEYFNNRTDLRVKAIRQKFRVYLKFPVLKEMGLARGNETDLLFLKVEIFSAFSFCSGYKVEVVPLFKYNRSILIKTFDLPTLFSTKLRAILHRKWEKRNSKGELLVRAKGRDYFDLMWYLEKGIKPNLTCLGKSMTMAELKRELAEVIKRLDEPSIRLDLEPLIPNPAFAAELGKNLKNILLRGVREKL